MIFRTGLQRNSVWGLTLGSSCPWSYLLLLLVATSAWAGYMNILILVGLTQTWARGSADPRSDMDRVRIGQSWTRMRSHVTKHFIFLTMFRDHHCVLCLVVAFDFPVNLYRIFTNLPKASCNLMYALCRVTPRELVFCLDVVWRRLHPGT
jgi:hypothetical protein